MRAARAMTATVLLGTLLAATLAAAPGLYAGEDAALPLPGPEPEIAGLTVGDSGSALSWSTTATGTRVVRLTIDYGATQTCILRATATGQTTSSPWLLYFGHDSVGRVWQAVELTDLTGGMATHVHAGSFAVTESLPSGNWFSEITLGVTASGTQSFLVAGWGLRPFAPPFGNNLALRLTVSCSSAVTVTDLETGTQANAWKPYSMRGGVGHTTGLGLDTTTDVLDITGPVAVTTSRSHMRFRSADTAAAGLLQVTTPASSFNAVLDGDDDIASSGANGVYRATLTRAGVGEGQKTILLIVGTEPTLSI